MLRITLIICNLFFSFLVSSAPSEMRHSADLCEDENSFLDKRKQVVFEAMKKLLGKNGPKKLKQV